MKFERIKDDYYPKNTHKCPDCWKGRLAYNKKLCCWVCCEEGGGFVWCGRKYKKLKEGE